MSDQDTDSKQEKNKGEAALDIGLVSIEEAEVGQPRLAVDPKQGETEEVAEVLNQPEGEVESYEIEEDSEQEQEQKKVEAEAEVARSLLAVDPEQVEAEEVVEQVAEVLNQPEGEIESQEVEGEIESQEVEKTRPSSLKTKLEKVAEEGDSFIATDDNEISSSDLGHKASRDKMADGLGIEGLTEIVLDSAGAANAAAHSTNQSIHMLLGSVTTINKMANGLRKSNNYVLGFIITLGVVGLLSGATMLYVLQSAIKDATTINMAMGTKLVQFEKQMTRFNLLETQIIDVTDVNHQLGQRLEQVMSHLKKVGTESQQAASQQTAENHLMLGSVNDQILTSFDDLKTTTKAQQAVLTQLQKRIDDLQLQMKKIQNQDLVGKMKALIALEQERYFELEQAKLALETAQFEAKKKADAPRVEDTFITFGAKTK
jgi:hypothetical protein